MGCVLAAGTGCIAPARSCNLLVCIAYIFPAVGHTAVLTKAKAIPHEGSITAAYACVHTAVVVLLGALVGGRVCFGTHARAFGWLAGWLAIWLATWLAGCQAHVWVCLPRRRALLLVLWTPQGFVDRLVRVR